jgi:hypothetical protein
VGDRQAVQQPDRAATRDGFVGLRRGRHRLFSHQRDDGVDFGIDAFDLREMRIEDFARRHLFAGQSRRQFDCAHFTEFSLRT